MGVLEGLQVLVYDRGGLFTHVAEALAERCSKPLGYYTEWREAFPRSQRRMPGVGLENILRVDDFHAAWPDADLIIFPDIGDGSLQIRLREQGKLVFGSGLGAKFEEDKIGFNLWLAQSGLDYPEMYLIEGLDALKEFLQDPEHDDIWLKANDRGDLETFHHENWLMSERRINKLDHDLGPNRALIRIIAQRPVAAEDEIGYDGYMIDGQFAQTGIIGWEAKDALYVGEVVGQFPRSVRLTNAAIAAEIGDSGYRGLLSTEVREAKDGSFYFIDPTMRAGSPPSEAMMRWYGNWDEIMLRGAGGQLVEPRPRARFGAEVILRSDVKEEFLPILIPSELRQLVGLHNHCMINGQDYICPRMVDEIGASLGYGDSPREALEQAIEVAEAIKAEGLKFDPSELDALVDTADEYEIIDDEP